jgi:hypothetical protein
MHAFLVQPRLNLAPRTPSSALSPRGTVQVLGVPTRVLVVPIQALGMLTSQSSKRCPFSSIRAPTQAPGDAESGLRYLFGSYGMAVQGPREAGALECCSSVAHR